MNDQWPAPLTTGHLHYKTCTNVLEGIENNIKSNIIRLGGNDHWSVPLTTGHFRYKTTTKVLEGIEHII